MTHSTNPAGADVFLRVIVQGMEACVVVADTAGRVAFVSRAFAEHVGWTPEELVGLAPPLPYWPADQHDRLRGVVADLRAGKPVEFPLLVTYQRRDGTRFDAQVSIALLRDEAGTVLGRISTMQDVSGHRRTEQELLRLRLAVETSGEVVFLTDPDGVIQYVNPEFTRVYGWTSEEVVGKKTPRILKGGLAGPEAYEAFWSTLLAGRIVRGELVNKTKEGKRVRMDGSANPIVDDRGQRLGYLAIQRDVSERHELTEQLLQSQKMEAVGRLAGGVAHDFNNLLSAILSYTSFVMDEVDPKGPLWADLDEVRQAGNRAAALTRQLLMFSRRETARPQVLDLNDVIAGVLKLLRRTLGEDVSIEFDPGDALPPVKADPGHLEQILMNLAVNARDAMRDGGTIRIETARLRVGPDVDGTHALPAGSYAVIEVADSGPGIPPEILARIFEPFFTTKPAGKGTGLGLSIAYGLVQQMNGHVGVRSTPGQGATFTIRLPTTDEERVSVAPATAAAVRGGGQRVLLVEDEDAVRQITRRMLVAAGFRVVEASNVGEALLITERMTAPFDLLVTDIVMPHVSGIEGARRLVAVCPAMKVLFMSGYSAEVDSGQIAALGAQFLPKPFTRDALLAAVNEALGIG